jgi:two-component system, sensor histidine kinase LadS
MTIPQYEEGLMDADKLQLMDTLREAQERLHSAMHQLDDLTVMGAEAMAMVRHALHDYLSLTGGLVDLMLTDAPQSADATMLDRLHVLRHVTDLMSHTVERLGLIASLKREHLHITPINLYAMLRNAQRYFAYSLQRKQLTLHVDASEQTPYLWGDRSAVAVVLANIVSNAIKYSPAAKHIWIGVTWDHASVTCLVRDEGPGLSAEEQARLFERGVTLSSRPTAHEPQQGYGLALARELLELMGGVIWCESRLGAGATFGFRVPIAQTAAQPEWLTPPSARPA